MFLWNGLKLDTFSFCHLNCLLNSSDARTNKYRGMNYSKVASTMPILEKDVVKRQVRVFSASRYEGQFLNAVFVSKRLS